MKMKKDEDLDKLPETWVIFIAENDIMGKGGNRPRGAQYHLFKPCLR